MLKPTYTVNEFLADFSMSRSQFYKLVRANLIKTHKMGHKTLVLGSEAQAWLDLVASGGAEKLAA